VSDLAGLFPKDIYDEFFLHRDDPACEGTLFTYETFIEAARDWPSFGNEGERAVRLRELAAFLANVSHETTGGWATAPDGPYAWGLCFREEVGCGGGGCSQYCDASHPTYPCVAGQTYHGRGPMQLSWNYNYGQAGDALGVDLLANPALVATDGLTSWRCALWFWMTPQAPKPSAHDVMVGAWTPSSGDVTAGRVQGFGMTVNIINGGLECGIPDDSRVLDRVGFFNRYTSLVGVDMGEGVTCESMQSY
jgi:chitinase